MRSPRDRTHDPGTRSMDEGPSEELVRLSVNLSPAVAATLRGYAARKGVSVTEAIRRAISILSYVDAAQDRGASLNIEEAGKLKEVQFLC